MMSLARRFALLLTVIAAVLTAGCQKEQKAPPASMAGEATYGQQCAICHGHAGKGDTMISANYPLANLADSKWGYGSTREEIVKNITEGVPQTPMRGFKGALTEQEIGEVADYIVTLSKR